MGNQMSKLNIYIYILNVISFILIGLDARDPLCLLNIGLMAYFNWTTRRDGQMHGLVKVKLVER
jgi:hypothetical protein